MNNRKKSLIEENAENGVLGAMHTQKNFVKFYPAYQIDKVKVSFVRIGTSGQGFDIYMDLMKFDNLADDVLSGKLLKKILSEQPTKENPYPHSFRHVTGENAEKEIKISKAQKADINIYGKVGKEYMNIPCSYEELKSLCKMFKLTSKKRFDYLVSLYEKYEEKQASFRQPEDAFEENQVIHEDEPEPTVPNEATKEPEKEQEKKEPVKETQKSTPESKTDLEIVSVKTNGQMKKKGEFYVIHLTDGQKLYFNKNSIEVMTQETFNRLCSEVTEKSIKLVIKAEKNGESLLFKGFAS